jgi:thioredoxin-like negative regulator of GroEL
MNGFRGAAQAGVAAIMMLVVVPDVGRAGEGIEWAASFESAMEQARAESKFVMVDFYTTWCHWCRVLDQKTYSDARVAALADRMINVKVNAEAEPSIARQYRITGYPTVVFVHPDGEARKVLRGFKPPEGFIPLMEQVLDTRADRVHLETKLVADAGDRAARESYARALALGGEYERAAAQADTLAALTEDEEERRSLALDGLVYRFLAGQGHDLLRKDLRAWIDDSKGHPRRLEAKFYLGRIEERSGAADAARKLYSEVAEKDAPSWVQERAEARVAALVTG